MVEPMTKFKYEQQSFGIDLIPLCLRASVVKEIYPALIVLSLKSMLYRCL